MRQRPLSVDEAALFLVEQARPTAQPEMNGRLAERMASKAGQRDDLRTHFARLAVKKLHPDVGGDAMLFQRLLEARRVLDRP